MTLEEYKAMRLGDVQYELERRVNALIPDFVMRKAFRRALSLSTRKSRSQMTVAERTEIDGYMSLFDQIDPIEAAAQGARDRINALTDFPTPAQEAALVTW